MLAVVLLHLLALGPLTHPALFTARQRSKKRLVSQLSPIIFTTGKTKKRGIHPSIYPSIYLSKVKSRLDPQAIPHVLLGCMARQIIELHEANLNILSFQSHTTYSQHTLNSLPSIFTVPHRCHLRFCSWRWCGLAQANTNLSQKTGLHFSQFPRQKGKLSYPNT